VSLARSTALRRAAGACIAGARFQVGIGVKAQFKIINKIKCLRLCDRSGLAAVLQAAVIVAALLPLVANAQKYPTRPVRVVVGIAPGGGMDMISRALAHKLGEQLGQTVVVDNRPGAGGTVAMETAAAAAPDGHTLLIVSATSVIHPILYKARFDVLRDFAPVSQISAQGYLAAVNLNVPVRNIADIREELRASATPIPESDIWIAALCRQHGFPLLSRDRHFDLVAGTKRIDW